jgi:hypothetical protein
MEERNNGMNGSNESLGKLPGSSAAIILFVFFSNLLESTLIEPLHET